MEWSYIPPDSDKGFTDISPLVNMQVDLHTCVLKTQCLINLAKRVMLK